MPQQFTPEQIEKLSSLGITVQNSKTENLEIENLSLDIKAKKTNNIFPLLSISGLTLLSFSGLVLLKGKNTPPTNTPQINTSPKTRNLTSDVSPTPTQVPKSIQHYLLTSQQLFSKAIRQQTSIASPDEPSTIELLNQSILAATQAIKEFPNDYRGYQQRGHIYQSLTDSQPKLIDQSISDLAVAQKLNPSSAEITHTLASLYAKKGDAQKTIAYLTQTVALEPTKAQNFYDLAKIQQQIGLLPQALETYNRLITIVTDSKQKIQFESEKSALEKLIAQNPDAKNISPSQTTIADPIPTITVDSPTIQALTDTGLIIAAPEDNPSIAVSNQTDSNSLSGNGILLANKSSVAIVNENLPSASQVYVTVTKGGKNQNLQVLSKSNNAFVVGLTSPIPEDIEFKWWIIK